MPEFHADEPARQARKPKATVREIEQEEIDTVPYRAVRRQGGSARRARRRAAAGLWQIAGRIAGL